MRQFKSTAFKTAGASQLEDEGWNSDKGPGSMLHGSVGSRQGWGKRKGRGHGGLGSRMTHLEQLASNVPHSSPLYLVTA